jgi:dimeric dUTPase (all-alpha-NTP-PPase superfamily)
MNLAPLFEKQKELDERIIAEHGLEGQELLPQKILALQVELGELANEWRGFKFWSKNQKPRTRVHANVLTEIGSYHEITNPLLEEYVDCLHFILSIGNDLGYSFDILELGEGYKEKDRNLSMVYYFSEIIASAYDIEDLSKNEYKVWVYWFYRIGEMLGFTWEEIEAAYMDKNKVNHERQDNGY